MTVKAHVTYAGEPLNINRRATQTHVIQIDIAFPREQPPLRHWKAEHAIVSDFELIGADRINASHERLLKGDVKYQFMIGRATL